VLAGYPERLAEDEDRPGQAVGANSAIIYDGNGEYVGKHVFIYFRMNRERYLLGGTRKRNLFVADLPWVKPGLCDLPLQ
jgi:hypothetical protein